MKYLGIDYGLKRVGIAVTDGSASMAFARRVIERKTRQAFWQELLQTIAAEQAEGIVIGFPTPADGSDTELLRQVRNFGNSLKERTRLPVYLMDEALSSFEAEQDLRDNDLKAGLGGGKMRQFLKENLDAQAAARILWSFLDLPESSRSKL